MYGIEFKILLITYIAIHGMVPDSICNKTDQSDIHLMVRFFGKIRKRICDPRSYGFFDTKETQNPKKDYFVMTRQAGGTQYICQNDISLVLPKNSTRMVYK